MRAHPRYLGKYIMLEATAATASRAFIVKSGPWRVSEKKIEFARGAGSLSGKRGKSKFPARGVVRVNIFPRSAPEKIARARARYGGCALLWGDEM